MGRRVLSPSIALLALYEALANFLSANDLRLTVKLPTVAPGTPVCITTGGRYLVLREMVCLCEVGPGEVGSQEVGLQEVSPLELDQRDAPAYTSYPR